MSFLGIHIGQQRCHYRFRIAVSHAEGLKKGFGQLDDGLGIGGLRFKDAPRLFVKVTRNSKHYQTKLVDMDVDADRVDFENMEVAFVSTLFQKGKHKGQFDRKLFVLSVQTNEKDLDYSTSVNVAKYVDPDRPLSVPLTLSLYPSGKLHCTLHSECIDGQEDAVDSSPMSSPRLGQSVSRSNPMPMSMDDILTDNESLQLLKVYAKQCHCAETVDFWEAVYRLKDAWEQPIQDALARRAKKIKRRSMKKGQRLSLAVPAGSKLDITAVTAQRQRLVQDVVGMGFSASDAERAAEATQYKSAQDAANWLVENTPPPNEPGLERIGEASPSSKTSNRNVNSNSVGNISESKQGENDHSDSNKNNGRMSRSSSSYSADQIGGRHKHEDHHRLPNGELLQLTPAQMRALIRDCKRIITRFIGDNAPQQINIPQKMQGELLHRFDELAKLGDCEELMCLFDDCEKEMTELMRVNLLNSFLQARTRLRDELAADTLKISALTPLQLAEIVAVLQRGLDVRDRMYLLNDYLDCFVPSEAITWTVSEFELSSREQALEIFEVLEKKGIIAHVTGDHSVKDTDKLYFHFTADHSHKSLKFDEASYITRKMKQGLDLKDHTHNNKIYHRCFSGRQAVTFLRKQLGLHTRSAATRYGEALVELNFIEHCRQRHGFADENLMYVFTERVPEDEIEGVVRTAKAHMEIRDNTKMLTTYPKSFFGHELVTAIAEHVDLVENHRDRLKAARIGQFLLGKGIIQHVTNDHSFGDNEYLYQFVDDIEPITLSPEQLETYLNAIRKKLAVHSRQHKLRKYHECFIGSEAVSFLVHNFAEVKIRAQAVRIGAAIQKQGGFWHVENPAPFRDAFMFYTLERPKYAEDDDGDDDGKQPGED